MKKEYLILGLLIVAVGLIWLGTNGGESIGELASPRASETTSNPASVNEDGIAQVALDDLPVNVQESFKKYDEDGWSGRVEGQTEGTKAGGTFHNYDENLPTHDEQGNALSYREFDVNNKKPNSNRDAERFIKGSDGRVYFTSDHYATFVQII